MNVRKECCICKKKLLPEDKPYPQFQTNPLDPELICISCLPGQLAEGMRKYKKTWADILGITAVN